jgi:uncharacterized membrane protein
LTNDDLGCGETKLEVIVGYLLIIGVVTSVVFEVVGIELFYGMYGNTQISQDQAFRISGENFFAFIIQQTQHLFGSQNALVFMTLGILILLLTPLHSSYNFSYLLWLGKKSKICSYNIVCLIDTYRQFSAALTLYCSCANIMNWGFHG